MTPLEWTGIAFAGISLVVYIGDSFAVFLRDLKNALADKRLDENELAILEADARLVVKGVLKVISLFRSL